MMRFFEGVTQLRKNTQWKICRPGGKKANLPPFFLKTQRKRITKSDLNLRTIGIVLYCYF